MSTYDKSGVSAAQAESARRSLAALLKEEANRRCAECGARGPTWASVNLGVFVCLNCSGIHRSLGTHISKVRSATLDTWLPSQVAWAAAMGNARAAAYWEARLPPGFTRPAEGDMAALSKFIGMKYRDRAYAATEHGPAPPTLDNHAGHPFMAVVGGGGGDGGSGAACVPDAAAAPAPAAAPAAPPPPPRPQPAHDLVDLLGMHDAPAPAGAAPAAAAAPPPASPPAAAWAAFEAAPPPSAPTTSTAPPTTVEHDWDVFQAAEPALAAAMARPAAVGAPAAAAPAAPAPPPPPTTTSRPDHTAAIMRMFDAVPGGSAGNGGGSGRRGGPLLPDLSGGASAAGARPPAFGAPFLTTSAAHGQQHQQHGQQRRPGGV